MHYNRYRYYYPEVGRFVGKDPVGYAGGLNVYQYVPNPVSWIDPLGLERIKNTI
nr:RHS repeat-associated core domain-containing protein [Serratia liquefaciens]